MNTPDNKLLSKSVSELEWKKLSTKKIYFGHMSVGYNIIEGMKDIMKSNPAIKLNLQETTDLNNLNNGVFAHSRNGENMKPKTKVDAFVKAMDDGLAKQVNIAFFKFCYVDFNKDTDVRELFEYYKTTMSSLSKRYPQVTFIHATTPITTEGELLNIKTRIKDIIKTMLGRESTKQHFVAGNIKRHEFNTLLRKEFASTSIIDIERMESAKADGTSYSSKNGGTLHNSMVPAYTYDGGHLNENGRVWVADKVLKRLTELQ